MSDQIPSCEALDIAVRAAKDAQAASLHVSQSACGILFPFGTVGERTCPVCSLPVFAHLGFPDQRRVEAPTFTSMPGRPGGTN